MRVGLRVLRADRVLAGAAHRRQPLARIHFRFRGYPRSLPAGILDARHRQDKRVWVAIVLVLAVLLYLVELYLERSRRGYQLAAVREDEDAALSLGVPALRLKVAAIAASAALTAVAGALWAQYVGFVDPFYVFSIDLSLRFALAAILGGIGTPLGPFLGAALILMLETYLRARFGGIGAGLVGISLIIYGTALVVMMQVARAAGSGALDRRAAAAAPGRGIDLVSLLEVSGITKRFGGITANRDISSRWPPASWSASSARTGPASRRSSRSSAASITPMPAR